ncbi:LpqN/LpqT family lipoprotein [Mycobacterium shinjukuense]|uniref:Proline-rich 28 kDa antigen n=1 Tax=Mycobacterium shinjukuense TaxID=398694 RepID=A0A7I7MTR5_9MYCO|nr:LpqN/LpqT family lipoprotein [Mycobacterium shinjukuense]MCV6984099.1 LpqN/LpqT family lipoprotein [Mycobacterium shinjukuense]ORB69205.1 hypothetical protein BST45_10525 [Mycobacterium shinjukuense]BBX75668.1 proline-rich 28 kDa antigen [Mycobacterium shinjukuense]
MHQYVPTRRLFAAGMATGFIGVMLIAGGRASADPLFPPPPNPVPVPTQAAAPPVQNLTASPGGVAANRFAPAPAPAPAQAPALVASPIPATAAAAAPTVVAPMPPTMTPLVTGTLREYLQAQGVKLEAQRPQGFQALDITLPMPPRWTHVPDPNVPDAFVVIADRLGNSVYTSNAQVVVYKLVGNFDPAEAITHGYVDSQRLLAWQTTNASLANFCGFPSSIIEGTYRENDMTLNTSRRHVIATSGPDRYLVSLSVTTALSQAVADGPATDAIINGFRVTAPAAAAQTPAPGPARGTPPPAPPQAPPPTAQPAPLGVGGHQSPAPNTNPAQPPLTNLTPVPGR